MDRWNSRIAVVTGASGGIGSAIVKELMKHNVIVVGLDVKEDSLRTLSNDVEQSIKTGKFHGYTCNLSKEESIVTAFNWIEENVGYISILINCAGIGTRLPILELNAEIINRIFKINVSAAILCSRETVKSMLKNNINGHIINMNSIAGQLVPIVTNPTMIYSASKFALRIFSDGLRNELRKTGSKIRVTNISPGWVETSLVKDVSVDCSKLVPSDIAYSCIEALKTEPNVTISEITILPIDEY